MNKYISFIKLGHTIFALPFAIIGFFLASRITAQQPNWTLLLLIVLCMVFARSAAMAFNRLVDRNIDANNPRTAKREIPDGKISVRQARIFIVSNTLLFVATTYFINTLCFVLSPIAIIVVLGYSYTKRFTSLSHFILGLGLSLAPIGAFLAVAGVFHLTPILIGMAVLFWVAGFDILYAMQDVEFDTKNRLFSIPRFLGLRGSNQLSIILHAFTILLFLVVGWQIGAGLWFWIGLMTFGILLIYQHILVKPGDLSKITLAFFTTNGIASIIFCIFYLMDHYL